MPISPADFRRLALALPAATEAPHFDRAAFKAGGKIFATLAADGASANLKFTPEMQADWTARHPSAFTIIPGGWGRMGYTTVTFDHTDESTLSEALEAAWGRAAPPRLLRMRSPASKA